MRKAIAFLIAAMMLGVMAAGAAAQEGIQYTVSYHVPTVQPVIEKNSPVRVTDTRGGLDLPTNGSSILTVGLGLAEDNQGNYKVDTTIDSTRMFKDQACYYPAQPGLSYINEISGAQLGSGGYSLSRVVIKNKNSGAAVAEFSGDRAIKQIVFTNNQEASTADGRTVIIQEDGSTHIELHYTTATNEIRIPVDFYDYDITDGKIYNSSWTEIADRNADTIYVNTYQQGINSPDQEEWKGSGAKLAFGNQNTKSGLDDQKWNVQGGHLFNRYNSNNGGEHGGTTYQMTVRDRLREDPDGKKLPAFRAGIAYKEWFGPEAATGKTPIPGFELGFSNTGDTYTLKWVYRDNARVISNLDSFRKRDFYKADGSYNKSIYSNDFWPMDYASTYNASGHDIQFGDKENYDNGKRKAGAKGSADVVSLPEGDDGLDHNSYFGMRFSLQFELDPDYMGPLQYIFFGDDDMWVFLEKPDGSVQQIIDIGGVHSSVGQIADLWDYIYPAKRENEAAGERRAGVYKLHFFYTERGASGSTCYMEFTLPSVSVIRESEYRDLMVRKTVPNASDPDQAFAFAIHIDDSIRVDGDKIAYTIHEADGTQIPLPDETLNPDPDPTLQVNTPKVIRLRNGQYAHFKMISIDSTYTVTETDPTDGYSTSVQGYTVADGQWTAAENSAGDGRVMTGKIGNADIDAYGVEFINREKHNLVIGKDVINGRGDEQFDFTITLADGSGVQSMADVYDQATNAKIGEIVINGEPKTIALGHGQRAVVKGLYYGTRFAIEEAGNPCFDSPATETIGFDDEDDLAWSVKGTIQNETVDHSVIYTNTASSTDLKVVKRSADLGKALAGAVFRLSHACETCDAAVQPQYSGLGESVAEHVFKDVLVGHDYLLTETKAPDCYLRPRDPWKLRVKATGYEQFELEIVGEAGNLKINDANTDGQNPTFAIEIHDPEKYPAIELKLGAKKLYNDLIPREKPQFSFVLYAAEEKPVESASFNRDRYIGEATLLEERQNVRADIDFSTVLRYTHHDIYADGNGKEFYYLIDERRANDPDTIYDESVFFVIVRIRAVGGDDFTAGVLSPEIECYKLEKNGRLNRTSAINAQKTYEAVSAQTLDASTAVFRNFEIGDLPLTGDDSRRALYSVLLAAFVSGALALALRRRRKDG